MKRRAEKLRCRVCRRMVWVGASDDVCAYQVTAEDTPLDPFGEALALLDGRATWELRGQKLEHRAPWSIRQRQPGDPYLHHGKAWLTTVLADHDCGRPLPGAEPSPYWTTQPQPVQVRQLQPDQPPY